MLVVSVAGCTSSNTVNTANSGSGQNMAVICVNAFLKDNIKPAFSDFKMTNVRVLENGSNGARISATFYNSTANTTATVSLNIQQLSNVNDATTYFNNLSFGYTLGMKANTPTFVNPASAASKDKMGYEPSVRDTAYRINSISFTAANADFIMQQGEFATWGSESAVMG